MKKQVKKESRKKQFGEIALDMAKSLTKKDLEEALKNQKNNKHKRLGEALVEKGFLTQEQVNEILELQTEGVSYNYGLNAANSRLKMNQEKEQASKQQQQDMLKKHLQAIKIKQQEKHDYNLLNAEQKRIYRALLKWYKTQPLPIPDGILELHFKNTICKKHKYELILGSIDSTEKIKRMKSSSKLKEMLLVFKRGKKILLDFYNQDIKEKIFTFMFIKGKIQPQPHMPIVSKVITHFSKYKQKR